MSDWLLFDLNGTLTDPSALGEPWGMPELGNRVLVAALQTAMAETLAGNYHPLAVHLEKALRGEIQRSGLDAGRVDEALELAQRLPLFPEVAGALWRLSAAGHRLAVLTNSGADSGARTLEQTGVRDCFEQVLGVDAVSRFKPHPDTYAHALRELEAQAGEVTFVAAHEWDIGGAHRAGLRTAFIAREPETQPAIFPAPDLTVPDLAALAAQLGAGRLGG